MAKDDTTGTEAAPKKSGRKLLIILAVVLVVLGGGGFAGYKLLAPKQQKESAPVPGPVVVMDAITINLTDGHYLKLKLTLQATTEVTEAPDGSKALDIAIGLYSNRPMAELMSNAERERTKQQLTEKVVAAYTVEKKKEIMDVYFTTFVIQ